MAVDQTAVARVVGLQNIFVDLRNNSAQNLPQQVALFAQGATLATYPTTPQRILSAGQMADLAGPGSPAHLAAKALLPVNGDGLGTIPLTWYPLEDDGSGVAASGDITPGGSQTDAASYTVVVNNIRSQQFVINPGDTIQAIVTAMTDAINATVDMPIIATDNAIDLQFVSKWAGTSANNIFVSIEESSAAGTSFTITQANGGLVNPDVDPALSLIGEKWETIIINAMEIEDTTTLDKFQTWGVGREAAIEAKEIAAAFVGQTLTDATAATAIAEARPTDNINAQISVPGSKDLPVVIAARAVARIAVRANNIVAHDYASMPLTGITPGLDSEQWDYTTRDFVVKRGGSTTEVKDGVVELSDTVTFYHPSNEAIPSDRYVVDKIKRMNITYNVLLIFKSDSWNGAPLVPDFQVVEEPTAKKPKMAKDELFLLIDSLGLAAIISDVEAAKNSIVVTIDPQNPKRLNIMWTVQLSGNTNIISIEQSWGFYFGSQAA